MKIKVEVGKLVTGGNFNNDSFKAVIEFECTPANFGQLSSKFNKAFEVCTQKVDQQVARLNKDRELVSFDEEEIPF